jgi:hypothetical protein
MNKRFLIAFIFIAAGVVARQRGVSSACQNNTVWV